MMKIPNYVKETIGNDQVIIVATANKAGTPHLAAAKGLVLRGDDRVAFKNWFCFQTLQNITDNPSIAISLFGPDGEEGFQLIGTVEESAAKEMMNGYLPEEELKPAATPQTRLQLQIKVNKVLAFSTGPHSDDMVAS